MEELANSITCEVSREINQALYDKLNSYTKQQLRDMGFAFTTNGDIVTPDDMGDMAERFVKYERKKTHDKIEEWLKENFFNSHEIDCYGCFLEETEVTSSFDTVEEMMESFHRIMEE